MKWGNAVVLQLEPSVKLELDLNDKNFKNTAKLNWIPNTKSLIEIDIIEYEHLLTQEAAVDFEGDFLSIVNKNSKHVSKALIEPAFRGRKKGDHLQIERRGFQIVDNIGNSKNNQYKLIYIPDGKSKNMSNLDGKLDVKELMTGGGTTNKPAKQKKEKKIKFKDEYEEWNHKLNQGQIYLGGESPNQDDIDFVTKYRENKLDRTKVGEYPHLIALLNIMCQMNLSKINLNQNNLEKDDNKEENKDTIKSDDKKEKEKENKPQKQVNMTLGKELENFSKIKLVVGEITKAFKHETADKLFCEEIDLGEGKVRKIASGLVGYQSSADELVGKKVLVFANLKEKKLVGYPSHGMVMCACSEGRSEVKILSPPDDAQVGDIVTLEGVTTTNWDAGAKNLLKAWDDASKLLRTDENGIAIQNGTQLKINGKTMKSDVKGGWIS